MAVAPDIQYFIDCSCQGLEMASDTAYFLLYIYPHTNEYIDGYDRAQRVFEHRKHSDTLRDMGRYCEELYLDWRERHPDLALGPSRYNYETMVHQIEAFVGEYSVGLVNQGHTDLTPEALEFQAREYGFDDAVNLLTRSARRAHHDTNGYDPETLSRALQITNEQFDTFKRDKIEALADIRRALGRDDASAGTLTRDRKLAQIELRKKIAQDKRVAKRSVKAAERFLGEKTVRLFVGGEEMRITGKNCVYVIRKQGAILSSHGGAALELHTLDGQYLCKLCIYTAKVPLLDHVISLIFHIKAGEEDEILRAANAFSVDKRAHKEAWLEPFLPKKNKEPGFPDIGIPDTILYRVYREPDRQDRIDRLRAQLAAFIFDKLGEFCPPMETTKQMLLTGLDERRWAVTQAGRKALGIDRLPTNVEMAGLYREFEESQLDDLGMIDAAAGIVQEEVREREVQEAFERTFDVLHTVERAEMVIGVATTIDAIPAT
jgi:hypothetical protein